MSVLLAALAALAPVEVTLAPCVGELLDAPELEGALRLELAPRPVRVGAGTSSAALPLSLDCAGEDPSVLLLVSARRAARLPTGQVAREERARALALVAAELTREMAGSRRPAAPPGDKTRAAPAASGRRDWRASARSELRTASAGTALGLGLVLEQGSRPFGLRAGLGLVGVDSDSRLQLGLEAKLGLGLELVPPAPLGLELELVASGGAVGWPGGNAAPFAGGSLAALLRLQLGADTELLGSLGVANLNGTFLAAASLGLGFLP